jgi:MFS family permease
MLAPFSLCDTARTFSKMAATTTTSLATAGPSPSHASLSGLDGANFFIAGISAGFGPYVAAYLADQKWTQDNIGFVLTASALAGLLSQVPGGELLDIVRSKRALVVMGATMAAISAIIIAFEPSFPLVFTGLVLQGMTGGFLGPAITAISLGLVGHAALPQRLGRNQRFASTGSLIAAALMAAGRPTTTYLVNPRGRAAKASGRVPSCSPSPHACSCFNSPMRPSCRSS